MSRSCHGLSGTGLVIIFRAHCLTKLVQICHKSIDDVVSFRN